MFSITASLTTEFRTLLTAEFLFLPRLLIRVQVRSTCTRGCRTEGQVFGIPSYEYGICRIVNWIETIRNQLQAIIVGYSPQDMFKQYAGDFIVLMGGPIDNDNFLLLK
mmetsp:Transcript_659/g.1579  ORF Transcript_659/g.1579 Transcript_659/m.1579 type:complete len:108 (-) Transcript_659:1896-2219(-)